MGVTSRNVIFYEFVSARYRKAVQRRESEFVEIIEQIFVPIKIGIAFYGIEVVFFVDVVSTGVDSPIVKCGEFFGVEEVGQAGGLLHIELSPIVDPYLLIVFAAFGLDEDYAVGCTGSVNGCRRTVFEHGDALYVIGIEVGKTHLSVRCVFSESGNSIDDQEGCTVDAADTYVRFFSRAGVAARILYRNTGYEAYQSLVYIHDGHTFQVFSPYHFDRAGE